MAASFSAKDLIKSFNYDIEKLQFLEEKFPGIHAKRSGHINNIGGVNFDQFHSKLVNDNFTNCEVTYNNYECYLTLWHDLQFKEEMIRIYGNPKKCFLAKAVQGYHEKRIVFSKFSLNLKNKSNDELISKCRTGIMGFIQSHPEAKLDTTNLEPKLKNLLLFT